MELEAQAVAQGRSDEDDSAVLGEVLPWWAAQKIVEDTSDHDSENDVLVAQTSSDRAHVHQQQDDAQNDKPISLLKLNFSLLGNKKMLPTRKKGYYAFLAGSPSDFRNAVDKASTSTTTEVVDSLKKVIFSENLDGCYDVQYERDDGKRSSNVTLYLTFNRGFCGGCRHVRDKRNGPDDGSIAIIRNGFLARSSRMYGEEHEDCEAAYHVLVVVGQLETDAFHGEWLSSIGTQTGRFSNFIQGDNKENKSVDVLPYDIV